jgi:hypothetical protein
MDCRGLETGLWTVPKSASMSVAQWFLAEPFRLNAAASVAG